MGNLFDAAAMYDEDYLYFFAAPGGLSEFAVHGPVVSSCTPRSGWRTSSSPMLS
jgi:hypothetical protein